MEAYRGLALKRRARQVLLGNGLSDAMSASVGPVDTADSEGSAGRGCSSSGLDEGQCHKNIRYVSAIVELAPLTQHPDAARIRGRCVQTADA